MRTRWPFLVALAAAAFLVYKETGGAYWSDFGIEAFPSYKSLQNGELRVFLELLPPYAGYLTVVGAPFALVAGWLGGVEELTFALTAVPAAIALALVTNAIVQRQLARGAKPLAILLGFAVPLPMAKLALEYGHPEDLVAASAAVGAVFAALRGKTTLAALLLALGIVSKQWAILAVLPAMLVAPHRQIRMGVAALAGAAAVLLPLLLLAPHAHSLLVSTIDLFHSQQIFWPLGDPVPPGVEVPKNATMVAPGWLSTLSHPLIVAIALPLSALWWRRGGRREDALALLALLFLGRCALDPLNLHYYHLPLVLALLAWEVERGRTLPVLSLATAAAVWLSFFLPGSHYGTGLFLLYMAWVLPLGGYLAWTLYGAPLPSMRPWHAGQTSAAPPSSRSTSTT